MPTDYCHVIIYARTLEASCLSRKNAPLQIASAAVPFPACAAVSLRGNVPQILRRASISHYMQNTSFVENKLNIRSSAPITNINSKNSIKIKTTKLTSVFIFLNKNTYMKKKQG
jgi:hypothetical protein